MQITTLVCSATTLPLPFLHTTVVLLPRAIETQRNLELYKAKDIFPRPSRRSSLDSSQTFQDVLPTISRLFVVEKQDFFSKGVPITNICSQVAIKFSARRPLGSLSISRQCANPTLDLSPMVFFTSVGSCNIRVTLPLSPVISPTPTSRK